ncbi:MAG: hypothetical protein KGR69_10925 [Verrucomicrobia bacterium]|nr:hypothetical protein [Verrucomicrobiota bacterium]
MEHIPWKRLAGSEHFRYPEDSQSPLRWRKIMKIRANSSSLLESKISFRRFSPGVVVGAACLLISGIAMGDVSVRRQLREFGYNGNYSGVLSGDISFRTTGTGNFTVVPVSEFTTEKIPQPTRMTVEGYFGSGNSYSLYVQTSVNKQRAIIRGLYFGERFNPRVGATTIRTGSRRLEIRRNARTSMVGLMTLTDRLTEFNSAGAILAQWDLESELNK